VLDGQKHRRRDVIYSRSFTMSGAELANSTRTINLPVRISITEISFLSLTNAETLILQAWYKSGAIPRKSPVLLHERES